VPTLSCGVPRMLGIVGKIVHDQFDNSKDFNRRQGLMSMVLKHVGTLHDIDCIMSVTELERVHPPSQRNESRLCDSSKLMTLTRVCKPTALWSTSLSSALP
jgi:hypothetical protein